MSETTRPAGPARHRVPRLVAASLLTLGLLTTGACGFQAQTLQPYTPAEGTNLDVGNQGGLKIRNLVVISRGDGVGIISASLVSPVADQLTGVSVTPTSLEGVAGQPASATLPAPVGLTPETLTVLTNGTLVTVQSTELVVGGSAAVTMTFAVAGQVPLNAPVVDGTLGVWQTITPSPTPSPTPSTP